MAQGKKSSQAVVDVIHALVISGMGAARIHRTLHSGGFFDNETAIDVRTVQRYVNQLKHPELRTDWDRTSMNGGDAKLVLEVISRIAELTIGYRTSVTSQEASWILWVRQAAPDMPLDLAWLVAVSYVVRSADPTASLVDLDVFISCEPWLNSESSKRYATTMREAGLEVGYVGRVFSSGLGLESGAMSSVRAAEEQQILSKLFTDGR